MGFTDQFTNTLIAPVNKRYRLITLMSDVDLVWPIESATSSDTLLEWVDVTQDMAGWDINFPDATGGSQGFASIIVNTGAYSFTVNDNGGNVIQAISAGEAWLIWLKDNSTSDGDWQSLQIGSTTSEASASTLAGNGLTVIGLTLNQSHPVWGISSDYTVVPTVDRARLIKWTSGAGTITYPSSVLLGNNWFNLVSNQGSGSIDLQPDGSETIDGASTKSLAIGESCFVVSDGSSLYTVGYGRSVSYIETYSNINVAGSSNITLTSAQFSSNIIRIFGALTGDIDLIVPAAVHTFIIVNATTGSYSVTVKVSGQPGSVAQQTNSQVMYCDGTDVSAGNTVNTIATGLFSNGTVSAPSISFSSDTNTGFFLQATDTIGIAAGGVLAGVFETTASAVNNVKFKPSISGSPAILGTYSGTDTNVSLSIAPQGSGVVNVTSNLTASNLSGTNTGDQTITLTGNVTGSGTGSFATTIANSAVTNAMLAGSIAASKLIGTDIATVGTITTGTWNATAIGLSKGGTNANLSATGGTSQVLQQTSVGASVTVGQLAASNLSNGTTGSGSVVLSASPTLTGTANFAAINASGTVNLSALTASQLVATDGSKNLTNVTALPNGTTATTQSVGDNSQKVATTEYADLAGKLVLIATATASSSASISFTSIPATYDKYVVVISGLVPVTNSVTLLMTVSEDNGASYKSSSYLWTRWGWDTSGGSGVTNSASTSSYSIVGDTTNNNASTGINGTLDLYNLGSTSFFKQFRFNGFNYSGAGLVQGVDSMGEYFGDTNAIDAIKFAFSSGNISTGKFALYGIRNS